MDIKTHRLFYLFFRFLRKYEKKQILFVPFFNLLSLICDDIWKSSNLRHILNQDKSHQTVQVGPLSQALSV